MKKLFIVLIGCVTFNSFAATMPKSNPVTIYISNSFPQSIKVIATRRDHRSYPCKIVTGNRTKKVLKSTCKKIFIPSQAEKIPVTIDRGFLHGGVDVLIYDNDGKQIWKKTVQSGRLVKIGLSSTGKKYYNQHHGLVDLNAKTIQVGITRWFQKQKK